MCHIIPRSPHHRTPHHARRRQALEAQSSSWIRPEELDARIDAALDNPLPLGQLPDTFASDAASAR